MNFTSRQLEIINLNKGRHLVVAPAGSGKTELLCQRIIKAIESGLDPYQMACLTFTNKAARNMLERFKKENISANPFIGNIHSWCVSILKEKNLLPNNVSFIDEEEQGIILQELDSYNEVRGFIKPKTLIAYNYNYKLEKLDLLEFELPNVNDEVLESAVSFRKAKLQFTNSSQFIDKVVKCCEGYEKIKARYCFMDYDDILLYTYQQLRSKKLLSTYLWVELDETQDFNAIQWGIVHNICKKETNLVVFADFEQAIYSFLGANMHELFKMKYDDQNIRYHFLSANFRSPKYIIDLLNDYSKKHLGDSWDEFPFSALNIPKTKNSVVFLKYDQNTQYNLGQKIGESILNKILAKNPNEKISVLFRTNKDCNIFYNKLIGVVDSDIYPIVNLGNIDYFQRAPVKFIFCCVELLYNPFNLSALSRFLYSLQIATTTSESNEIAKQLVDLGYNILKENNGDDIVKLHNFLTNDRVVVFDTETTGLSFDEDNIIQIAAQEIIGGVKGKTFEVYLFSSKAVGESEKIHHISDLKLKEAGVEPVKGLNMFFDFIDNSLLIAHNSEFDEKFVNTYCSRVGLNKSIDTVFDSIYLAKVIHKEFPSYKLEYLLKRLKVDGINSHNALDDVKATVNLVLELESDLSTLIGKRKECPIDTIVHRINRYIDSRNKLISVNNTDEITIVSLFIKVVDVFISNEEVLEVLQRLLDFCSSEFTELKNIKELYHSDFEILKKFKESDILSGENIIISTVHKCKGLEFDTVIIPHCSDDNFPFYYAKKAGKIEEEAKLLYVALSRTQKRLIVCYPKDKPSRFIKNLDSELFDTYQI